MAGALERWATHAADAARETEALQLELTALADPSLSWSDRDTVARLLDAAARAEALSIFRQGGFDPEEDAAVSASLFKVYLRENRRSQCHRFLHTFPSRITRCANEFATSPEDSANELSFTAAMAVASLHPERGSTR